ncbi:MAG: hypothetical protein K8R48_02915 [Alphaproteobacteria bacterium]|nr:hypothetical protein [Alphaproteobacteria bacterium]
MKISKIGSVFVDWMKATHRFGFTFTNYLAARTEMSPKAAKFGGGALDVLAGGFFTYGAATSIIGTVASIAAAVITFTAAPLAAVGAIAMGAVWLALSCLTASTGLGFLGAAREKAGIPPLFAALKNAKNNVKKKAQDGVAFLKKPFKGKKISSLFRKAANNNQPDTPAPKKPAPKPGKHFRL